VFLTEANVLYYLADKKFASLEDAVSGQFTVRSLGRRNRDFWIHAGDRHYFIKQVRKWDAINRSALDAEASLYHHSQSDPRFRFLQPILPACHAYDPEASALILEFLLNYASAFDSLKRFSPELARHIGGILGEFHSRTASSELRQSYPDDVPWFFSLHKIEEEDLIEGSPGRRELLHTIRRYPKFAPALDDLRNRWRHECLIHADSKLENWLVAPDGESTRLIDWECLSWGDPRWDVATLLQSYWNFFVRYPQRYSADQIQPALHAALAAYSERRALGSQDLVSAIIPFAAVRMLQSAFESLEKAPELTPSVVRLLQASLNILTRPVWAADTLLGAAWHTFASN